MIEVFDEGAKAIAMSGDDDSLALAEFGFYFLVPVRQYSFIGIG